MLLRNALKEIAKRSGFGQKKICNMAGYKSVSAISTPIARNDMNVSTLVRLANAVGFNVILTNKKQIDESEIEITEKEEC